MDKRRRLTHLEATFGKKNDQSDEAAHVLGVHPGILSAVSGWLKQSGARRADLPRADAER
jgi:hypothetical protein